MSNALTSLLNDFIAAADGEQREWLARAAGMASAMIEEGESDIALENFCENMTEWQTPIRADLFARLQSLASELGVEAGVVNALKGQVK